MCCQKNRNLLRRLTTPKPQTTNRKPHTAYLFLLSAFCLFTSCDKEDMLMRRWNLQSVKMNDKPYKDSTQYHLLTRYTDYVFLYDHLNVETYANGQFTETADGYYKLQKGKKLFMKFTILNQHNEFTAKIKKLNNKELFLEYTDKGNTYFLKLYSN